MRVSLESFLSAQRAANAGRRNAARLVSINRSRAYALCLTDLFIAEACMRLIAGFVEESMRKGLDHDAAVARARALYEAQCKRGDPVKEFGVYATTYYP